MYKQLSDDRVGKLRNLVQNHSESFYIDGAAPTTMQQYVYDLELVLGAQAVRHHCRPGSNNFFRRRAFSPSPAPSQHSSLTFPECHTHSRFGRKLDVLRCPRYKFWLNLPNGAPPRRAQLRTRAPKGVDLELRAARGRWKEGYAKIRT